MITAYAYGDAYLFRKKECISAYAYDDDHHTLYADLETMAIHQFINKNI
jgi:hypothetical protein